MADRARFWNRIAGRYAARPVRDEAAYARKLAMTRARLRPGMELLEIGCGTGSTAIAHAPHVARIRAVDLAPAMIEIARARAAEAGIANVAFEVGDVETLALAPESIDAVLALSVLHLLEDRPGALARLHGALRPGGLLVANTVCIAERMGFLRYLLPLGRWIGRLPYVAVIARADIERDIRGAGFEIEEVWQPERMVVFTIARKPD